MTACPLLEVVLHVEDVALAASFLSACGLPVLSRSPDFTLLDAGGVRLALRPERLAARAHDGSPLAHAGAPVAELVLGAGDVALAHEEAVEAGALSLLEPTAFPYGEVATVRAPGGVRVTYFARAQ